MYPVHTTPNPVTIPAAEITDKKIEDIISSIKAEQINMISQKISHAILSRIGSALSVKSHLNAMDVLIKFSNELTETVQKSITQDFTEHYWFLIIGSIFHLTDYDPLPFLKDLLDKFEIQASFSECPFKYSVYFTLDKEQTKEKGDLVFSLIEKSDQREINQQTFTL